MGQNKQSQKSKSDEINKTILVFTETFLFLLRKKHMKKKYNFTEFILGQLQYRTIRAPYIVAEETKIEAETIVFRIAND